MDKQRLIAWLRERAEGHKSPLVGAVYAGLADRIARGEFDMEGGAR